MVKSTTPPSPFASPTTSETSDKRLLLRLRTHRRRKDRIFSLLRDRLAHLVTGDALSRLTPGRAHRPASDLDLTFGILGVSTKLPLDVDPRSTAPRIVSPQLTNGRRLHRNGTQGAHSLAGRSLLYPATRRSNLDHLARAIISGCGTTPPATTSSLPHAPRLGGTQPNPHALPNHLGHSSSA